MQLTETVKLKKCKYMSLIISSMSEYVSAVNSTVSLAVDGVDISKFGSGDIKATLNSAIRNQAVRDARSVYRKYHKNLRHGLATVPVVRRQCMYINNQNFIISDDKRICIPLIIDGKSKRVAIPTHMTDRQYDRLIASKLGTLRIVFINRKLCAQIVYEMDDAAPHTGQVMGVDLGIKCPAVSYTESGKIKFYGNGRQNKYMRRHYAYLRKKLQQKKKIKAVKRISNKENRIMRDVDHKLSRDIVNTAIKSNVSVIKLERLQNIRSTARTSRKNNHSLHNWSFYRLASYIEYKAKFAGIAVQYVNPAYTSQKCPSCGELNHSQDRHYVCKCGFHAHRDIVGAMNIRRTTERDGDGEAVSHVACGPIRPATRRVVAHPHLALRPTRNRLASRNRSAG